MFQYLISRYFSSETALEQLSWLLKGCGISMPIGLVDDMDLGVMSAITFKRFNMICPIIDITNENEELLRQFSYCIDNIKEDFQYPQYYNGLMGILLLFSNDDTYDLKEPHSIQSMLQEIKELAVTGYEEFQNFGIPSLNKLIITLHEMANVFRKVYGDRPFEKFGGPKRSMNEMDCFEDNYDGYMTQVKPIDYSISINQKDHHEPCRIVIFYQHLPLKNRLDYEKQILESFHKFEDAFASVTSGYVVTTCIGKKLQHVEFIKKKPLSMLHEQNLSVKTNQGYPFLFQILVLEGSRRRI